MKKSIVIIIIILAAVLGISAFLNKKTMGNKIDEQKNAVITIKDSGKEYKMDLNSILKLDVEEFDANLKKSGKAPVKHKYKGVDIVKIFDYLKINTEGKDSIIGKSIDGYSSAIGIDEIVGGENAYIVFEMDGKELGNKEDGGSGPLMLLIRKDKFSQRWCKFLMEVELN